MCLLLVGPMFVLMFVLLFSAQLPAADLVAGPDQALAEARRHFSDPDINVITFRNADHFFPVDAVQAGQALALPSAGRALNPRVHLRGEWLDFDTALVRTNTSALLVIQDGEMIDERYLNGATPEDTFIAWSISKSVVSVLTGIALQRGDIEDLDDAVVKYLPDLTGTAYENVTIRQMLEMRAGTSYREFPGDPPPHIDILREYAWVQNQGRFTDVRILGLKQLHTPGTVFNYSTLTASILGSLLEAATGQRLAALTQDWLWQPAGMADPAYWIMDGQAPEGRAIGGGGFNASLRDLGRFGLLMLNSGKAAGKQVVPADWVHRSTETNANEVIIPQENRGYAWQWWTVVNSGIFEAIGIHGQFVSVDPSTRSVIVKLSYWPEKGGLDYELDTLAVFDAIRKELR